MGRLNASLLGGFAVSRDEQAITGFRSDKARALLAYLLVEGDRPHRRESLAALLWPDQPEAAALVNLRQTLTRLRRAIEDDTQPTPVVLVTPQTVQLNPAADVWLDVAHVQARLAACARHRHPSPDRCRACAERLEQVAELYRGPFLAGLTVEGSAAFETWLMLHRQRLSLQMSEALGQLAAYYRRRAAYGRVIETVRRQIQDDPWREEAHRLLMEALALSGQRHAAVTAYQGLRASLLRELDLEPEAATTALYERLRAGRWASDQPPPPPRRDNVPALATPLLGRRGELARLAEMLTEGEQRLITLVGPPGVGKTRLALELATEQRDDFSDGTCFVPLAAVHDPALVADTVVRALGTYVTGETPLEDVLAAILREQHRLLVLDNFEQVDAAAPLVGRLVAECPWLSIVVTSRVPLHLRSERQFPVQPLPAPPLLDSNRPSAADAPQPPLTAIEIAHYPAVQLFVDRARAVDPGFRLSPSNAEVVGAICAQLDGLPLAIELAAARVKAFALPAILARLTSRLHVLTDGPRDLPDRQRSLRAAIAWSYDLLTPAEQTLFARLAVFEAGATVEAAEAVVGVGLAPITDHGPPTTVVDGVQSLVIKSLVQRQEGAGGEPRFTLLETVREYAAERLKAAGEADRVHRAHADFFLGLAVAARRGLAGAAQLQWLARLDAEHNNLRAALKWLVEHPVGDAAVRLASSLAYYWEWRGYLSEGRRWLEAALASHDGAAVATPHRAQGYADAAFLAYRHCDYAEATRCAETSLALSHATGDLTSRAVAVRTLGNVLVMQGQLAAALRRHEEGLALYRAIDDVWGIATELGNLGVIYTLTGDYAQGEQLCEEALTVGLPVRDRRLSGGLRLFLSRAHMERGDFERGEQVLLDALADLSEVRHVWNMAHVLTMLAACVAERGDAGRAGRLLGVAAAAREFLGIHVVPYQAAWHERTVAKASAQLGAAFAPVYDEGRAMSLEEATAYALEPLREVERASPAAEAGLRRVQ